MAYLKMRTEIEVAVRDALNDPTDYGTTPDGTDARWNRVDMLFYLNAGIKDIRRKQSESKLAGREVIDFVAFTTTNHTNDSYVILSDRFYNLIVSYIAWKCYAMDDENEQSARKADKYAEAYYGGV